MTAYQCAPYVGIVQGRDKMTRVMAGLYAIAVAAFIVVSMYLTGALTTGDVTAFVGIS